jgi:hypothetical protein
VAAREAGHEAGRVAVALKGQGGQLEPGRPAPGPVLQGGHGRRRQLGPEGGRLLGGQAQVGGAQLGELAAGPQPGQGQRRVGPAGQHQPQPGRAVLEQEPERGVHRPSLDQLVVVDHQQHLARLGGQLVDQGGDQPLERRRGRRAQQRGELLGELRLHPVQGGQGVAPEPCRVVVAGVQRQPGQRPPGGGPAGQQGGPAGPGGSADQDQPPGQPLLQPVPSRGRATKPGCGRGTCSLVASSVSRGDASTSDGMVAAHCRERQDSTPTGTFG